MKPSRFAALLLAAVLCAPVAARADDSMLGKSFKVGPNGQPFCTDKDELGEFLLAALKHDDTWISALKTCAMLRKGLKIAVIEDLPSDSDIGHVVKVRAFGPGMSVVGYTLSIGLTAQ